VGGAAACRIPWATVAAPGAAYWKFRFGGLINPRIGETGETQTNLFLSGTPALHAPANLSESMSFWSEYAGSLVGAAILFAIVVLVAMLIGVGLTRKIYLLRGQSL